VSPSVGWCRCETLLRRPEVILLTIRMAIPPVAERRN
jgi:hypothetical protein